MSRLSVRKIGIALAAYRPPIDVFAAQLASIRDSDFANWVCVITCDSPLGELAADPRLKPFRDDSRFVWIENPVRLGHKKNFERAIQASLEYGVDAVACSDQDDVWYPHKLSICANELELRGPLSLVHSDTHVLEGKRILDRTTWQIEHRGVHNAKPRHLLVRNVVAGCTMLFDAELARRYPRIPEEAEYHDHWYALVAAAHGGVYPIAQPLAAYRQHEGNVVGVSPYQSIPERARGMPLSEIAAKCRKNWKRSLGLVQAAKREGVPIPARELALFLSRVDGGTGIIALGLAHAGDDPLLLRACLVRGAGKALAPLDRFFPDHA